jgi:hypothetical protein
LYKAAAISTERAIGYLTSIKNIIDEGSLGTRSTIISKDVVWSDKKENCSSQKKYEKDENSNRL